MRGAIALAGVCVLCTTAGASSAAPQARARAAIVAIEAGARTFGGVPVVYGVVTPRAPMPSMTLRIVGEPALAPSTPVRWTAPDGKNAVAPSGGYVGGRFASSSLAAVAGDRIEVYPHEAGTRGSAIIVADVGGPVPQRATLLVLDVAGSSFGCYAFTTAGPSVRFEGDVAVHSSLADSDVAVLGPGDARSTGPAPGCSGENFDPAAASPRLIFGIGGRVARPGRPAAFVRALPYDAVDGAYPLEVETHDGSVVRLHVNPAGGTYFYGWTEPLDGTSPLRAVL